MCAAIGANNNARPEAAGESMSWAEKAFSKKQLYKKMPIFEWLPTYTVEKGVSDFIAGITVGLTVIPQGIAYALIANLPPEVMKTLKQLLTLNIA